ncbi:ferritin-like domain-containing protein [Streptomyces sp. NPDC048106]|uniref:ferritin-like domain-containing protein n=1 Tax=Streptomyces sp. NPDC048106 TaxID=3155750 RepID=UPI00345388A7
MSDGSGKTELAALQAALAAEHAAVYGYGVVGGRVDDRRRTDAKAAYDAHRARRDALAREVRDLGGRPVAASAAYTLPFTVRGPADAVRLAAQLEERVAGVYADLVRSSAGARRASAAGALREAAVRAVGWSGQSVAFPGLAERAGEGTGPGAGTETGTGAGAAGAAPSGSAPTGR